MRRLLYLSIVAMGLYLTACKKKDAPKPPEAVNLIFPERNSVCTEGNALNASTTEVTFRWEAADNTDTYELRVTNNETRSVQTITTTTNSAQLPIARGTPFSWFVVSKNNQVDETANSPVWSFYNQGSTTTYVPFPATILAPESAESVFKDVNNQVALSWTATDLDNDISEVLVYFSLETTPGLFETLPSRATTLQVTVSSDTVYYWKVVLRDAEGNESDSGVYSFRVL